jgi:hypothetical protein
VSIDIVFASAAAATTEADAVAAIAAHLPAVRRDLEATPDDRLPRLVAVRPGGDPHTRLSMWRDNVRLARMTGNPEEVAKVIDAAMHDIERAAMFARRITTY